MNVIAKRRTYLFVQPRVWLDLSYDQTDYRPAVNGG